MDDDVFNSAHHHHHHQHHHHLCRRRQRCRLHWIIVPILILPIISTSTFVFAEEIIFRVDPLALLSDTLRQFHRRGCDSGFLTLNCPRGTSISIDIAQYSNIDENEQHRCLPPTVETAAQSNVIQSDTEVEVKPPKSCYWPRAIQYSLLQTVVESCQKKQHCRFETPPKTFGGDPCPGIQKFVDVKFKCRPYEFRKKLACENDVIQLTCNPYSRIAVYSASYGRTEHETIQCTQPLGVKEETCLAQNSTEVVMEMCHGKRKCSIKVDSATFGKPCSPTSRMYLKVVYTCVPRKVLRDQFNASEADEQQYSDVESEQDEVFDDEQVYVGNEAPKIQGPPQSQDPDDNNLNDQLLPTIPATVVNPPKKLSEKMLEDNQERFFLYLLLSVSTGILICLFIIIVRFVINRHNDDGNGDSAEAKIQTSTTGETVLSSRASGDIEQEQKYSNPDHTQQQIRLPSTIRDEPYHQDYAVYTSSRCSTPPVPCSIYNQSMTMSQQPVTYFVPSGKIITNPCTSIIPQAQPPPTAVQSPLGQATNTVQNIIPYGITTIPRHGIGPPQFFTATSGGSIIGHHPGNLQTTSISLPVVVSSIVSTNPLLPQQSSSTTPSSVAAASIQPTSIDCTSTPYFYG